MNVESLKNFLSVFLLSVAISTADEQVKTFTVATKLGPVKGLVDKDQETGEPLYIFRGIQYGKAPVRFEKPEPVSKWTETLDATEFGPSCAQFVPEAMADITKPAKMSEDCLFLNIYVPKTIASGKKLSVMVWIHGGGLMNGNGDFYHGGWLAMHGDVIVVTFNYRLGIFGFLALDHPAARGNYGIWDQKLALKWVHDNIESFGGNPDSVTIFGESAGGWSVSFQSLIPSNKGLFQRVIAQSGVVSRAGVLNKKVIKDAIKDFSDKLSCPYHDMYKLRDCLREKSTDELLNQTNFFAMMSDDNLQINFIYQPAVDYELFLDHPIRLLENSASDVAKFFGSLDFMAGTNSNEGNLLSFIITPTLQDQYEFNFTEGIPSKFVCDAMIKRYVERNLNGDARINNAMCQFYTSAGSLEDQSQRATDCYADLSFVYPTSKMLEYHASASTGSTYQYQFSRVSESPLNAAGPPPTWFRGSGHAEELCFLFDLRNAFPGREFKLTEEEKKLSRQIIQYWTSFAKSGNPEGRGLLPWTQFNLKDRSYIDFDIPTTMKKFLRQDMVKFMSELLPSLSNGKSYKDEL